MTVKNYHNKSEKHFASIFMTTKYIQLKLKITRAKIDTTKTAR